MAPIIVRQASSELEKDKNGAVLSICAVFLVLSSTGLATRIVSKRMKGTQFLFDDILLLWAYVNYDAQIRLIRSIDAWGWRDRDVSLG